MDSHVSSPLRDSSDAPSPSLSPQGLRWEPSRMGLSGLNFGYMSAPLHLDLLDWMSAPSESSLSHGAQGSPELSTPTEASTPQPPTPNSGDPQIKSEQSLTKPPYDYKTLVIMALENGGGASGMTICGIYDYVLANFAYYRSTRAPPTWRSRIRNVLTVNDCFKRIPDPKGGRKGKWVLQRGENDSGSDNKHGNVGLKSPLAIRTDKNGKTMARSLSNMALTPTSIVDLSDSESTTNLSMADLKFSFEDDDIRAADPREHEKPTATFFRAMPQPSAHTMFTRSSMSTPSLMFTTVDGGRALSAASLEMVDQLAAELKEECTMLSRARASNASGADN